MSNQELYKSIIYAYYTPNVQFEILFGSLLTPYLAGLINNVEGMNVKYIASEIPFLDKSERKGNEGPKADFLVADENKAYLVELKTVKDTKKHPRWSFQSQRYEKALKDGKIFGEVVGKKLLNIIVDKYSHARSVPINANSSFVQIAQTLLQKWEGTNYLQKAMNYLKDKSYSSSHKYLFTLAQIADYLTENPGIDLWIKDVDIIYLLPEEKETYKKKDSSFYNSLENRRSINFFKGVQWLEAQSGYGSTLAEVISKIYKD